MTPPNPLVGSPQYITSSPQLHGSPLVNPGVLPRSSRGIPRPAHSLPVHPAVMYEQNYQSMGSYSTPGSYSSPSHATLDYSTSAGIAYPGISSSSASYPSRGMSLQPMSNHAYRNRGSNMVSGLGLSSGGEYFDGSAAMSAPSHKAAFDGMAVYAKTNLAVAAATSGIGPIRRHRSATPTLHPRGGHHQMVPSSATTSPYGHLGLSATASSALFARRTSGSGTTNDVTSFRSYNSHGYHPYAQSGLSQTATTTNPAQQVSELTGAIVEASPLMVGNGYIGADEYVTADGYAPSSLRRVEDGGYGGAGLIGDVGGGVLLEDDEQLTPVGHVDPQQQELNVA